MKNKFLMLISALILTSILVMTSVSALTISDCNATATGGNITINGDYCVHTFLANGSFNVPSGSINATILVVAGGGGGGGKDATQSGGGGGAGGLIYNLSYIVTGNIGVVVGLGGLGKNAGYGDNGLNSSFGLLNALGGGGGGYNGISGQNGGSGAGGGGGGGSGGNGFLGQGYNGGNSGVAGGGGGGGSSQNGENGFLGGLKGGNGTLIDITGTPTYYGGGGGSGQAGLSNCIDGGLGGGGSGSQQGSCQGTHGVNGTGGGGGGTGGDGTEYATNGGSGIVIISYLLSSTYDVQFVTPTDVNNYGYQRQFILVNVTADNFGAGLSNITIRFYNSSRNQIASVNQASSPLYYNYSTGIDGNFYFNATACDINNVCNSTETRLVRLDTFNPVVNIEYPEDLKIYGININRVSFSAVNTGTINDCWIILNNNGTNISVPNCSEAINMTYTGFTSLEGVNTIEVWAKDLVNLTGSHSHLYAVDTTPPTINLTYPTTANYTSLITTLNYTYSDSYAGFCWYSNNSGITNSTPIVAGTIFTNVVTTEGTNNFIIYCNDSVGNLNTQTRTFNINLPIIIPSPAYEGNTIYQTLRSAGAGLGSFIQVIAIPLFIFLILIALVIIIVIIGGAIAKTLKQGVIKR